MSAHGTPEDAGAEPQGEGGATGSRLSETIAAALDERRDGPRVPLREDCMVLHGPHVQQATVRDVSAGGAMLHGLRGVIAGDPVRIRLERMPNRPIAARVRGISLLGAHIAIEGEDEKVLWREALKDVLA